MLKSCKTIEENLQLDYLVLASYAKAFAKDKDGWTALIHAAEKGRLDIVNTLLVAKPDINIQQQDDLTALILATCRGDKEIIRGILEAKADVNIWTKAGMTALDIAKKIGEKENDDKKNS